MIFASCFCRLQMQFVKVMFLHLSVILFTGVVSGSVHAGIHCPRQTPLWADTHPGHTPPRQCMLGYTSPLLSACWDRHGYCCGRYASCWSAFLFKMQTFSVNTVICCHKPYSLRLAQTLTLRVNKPQSSRLHLRSM